MFCYSVTKVGKNNLEQYYAIKFCVELGEGAIDTYEKIQKAFGTDSLSRAQLFRWHKDFSHGRGTVEDEPRSRRPASVRTSINVDHVKAFIRQDQRLTIRMIVDELNINECTVHKILTQDFNMRTVSAKTIPKKN
jgi:hypothetical protein